MIKDEYSFVIEPSNNVPLPNQENVQSGDIMVGLGLVGRYNVGMVRSVFGDSFCYDFAFKSEDPYSSFGRTRYDSLNELDCPVVFLRKKEGRLEVVAVNSRYTEGLVKLQDSHLRKSAKETKRRCR